jgi:hemolysin activation/secretion protein
MPKHFIELSLIVFLSLPVSSFPLQRTLKISGLKIYSEEELKAILNLDRYKKNEMSAKQVIDSIVAFYSNNGFTLVKVYVIKNSRKELSIYVDEGALGKIIFLNIDDFTTIYLKIVFKLKDKIFNVYTVRENIETLRRSSRFKDLQ